MRNTFRRIGLAPWGMTLVLAAPLFGAGSIVLSPQNESITVSATRVVTATVTGLANPAVMWSVNGMTPGNGTVGTIDVNGNYTAPAAVPSPAAVTVQATSMMDSTVFGTTVLTIKGAGPTLTSLNPTSVTAGGVAFKVNGSGFVSGATAYLNGVAASTTFNSSALLTVSASVAQGTTSVIVRNPGSAASNPLYLSAGAGSTTTLKVTPTGITVVQGLTQQFTASSAGVTWSASAGTIDATGLYTAPATIPSPNSVTVTATGANNTVGTASLAIGSNVPPSVSSVSQTPIPVGVFSMALTGTGFVSTSQATLGNTALATSFVSSTILNVTGYAAVAGSSTITVSNGALVSAPLTVQIGVANPLVSAAAARRFLEQAAFGPSPAEASHVQQVGFQGWLTEQFAVPAISNFNNMGSQSGMGPRMIANAVTNADQLRQRVAFAMSQIFVTSLNKIIWSTSMAPYQNMLLTDAFVNFRQLLGDVTLHPVMANYLDMANNQKGNAAGTTLPNENYAREVLQLFTVGTSLLNPDGTPQVDAANVPLPTYDQKTISEFARVFTGWSYTSSTSGPSYFGAYINPGAPMIAYPAYHDSGPKTLLGGVKVPAGLSPKQDLDAALDNMFNHPNTAPFISRLMIQHLVKSNPSPAYVARVAAVFADNGSGVRGDMTAVVTAVLLDQEARQNDAGGQDQITDGHLQEPVLYIAGILRALNGMANDQNYFNNDLAAMGQDVFNAPSVFNYYSPFYRVPSFNIGGPEFQIYSPTTSIYRMNFVSSLFNNYQALVQTQGPGMSVDLTAYATLATTPASLVDALDIAFTHGTMPAGLKQPLVQAVQAENGGNLRRVQTALYLLLSSGYYNVWH